MRFLRRSKDDHARTAHGKEESLAGTVDTPTSSTVATLEVTDKKPMVKFLDLYQQQEQQNRTKPRFRGLKTMLASSLGRGSGKSYDAMDESTLFSSGNTYLWTACKIGDLQYVRRAVESCPDQLHLELQGRTPLYHACHCGHVAIVQTLLRAGCTDRDGTSYQSALTPEIRTLLRQYRLVDEQVYGSPSRRHHHFSAMTGSSSVVAGAAETGSASPALWSLPLDNRRQGSETLLAGPVPTAQLSLSPQGSAVPLFPHLPAQRIGELVDSDQMEGFCGASELFLPSQPPARSAIRPLDASFDLSLDPARYGPTSTQASLCDSAIQSVASESPSTPLSLGGHSITTSSTRQALGGSADEDSAPKPSEINESTKRSVAPRPDEQSPSQESTCGSTLASPIIDESMPKPQHLARAEEETFHDGSEPTRKLPFKGRKFSQLLKRSVFLKGGKPREKVDKNEPSGLVTSIAPVVEGQAHVQGPDAKRELADDHSECNDPLRSDRSVEVVVLAAAAPDPLPVVDQSTKRQRRKVPVLRAMAKSGDRGSLAVSAEVVASCATTLVSDAPTSPHIADLEVPARDSAVLVNNGDSPELVSHLSACIQKTRPVTPDKSIMDGSASNPASATVCTEASTTSGFSSIPSSPMRHLDDPVNNIAAVLADSSPSSTGGIEYVACDAAEQESIAAAEQESIAAAEQESIAAAVTAADAAVSVVVPATKSSSMERDLDENDSVEVLREVLPSSWQRDMHETMEDNDFEVTLENFVMIAEASTNEEAKTNSPSTPRSRSGVLVESSDGAKDTTLVSPLSPPPILRKPVAPILLEPEISDSSVSSSERNLLGNPIEGAPRSASILNPYEPSIVKSTSNIALRKTDSEESSSDVSTDTVSSSSADDISMKDETRETESSSSDSVEVDVDDDDDVTDQDISDDDFDDLYSTTTDQTSSTLMTHSPRSKEEAWCMFADDHCGGYG
jgi:Ankyrin repeats (3 copies)